MMLHHENVLYCYTIYPLILKAPHAQKQHAHSPAVLAAIPPSQPHLCGFVQTFPD